MSTTHPTHSAEEALMPANHESDCRAFAAEFPTPNVKRAIALAESGVLRWSDVAEVFRGSLAKGLREVQA